MVSALSEATQTDPGMAGTVALTALAVAVGGRAVVEIRPGWEQGLNLFTVVVARSGERKSDVQGILMGPLREQEARLVEENKAARRDALTLRQIADHAAALATVEAGKAPIGEREALEQLAISAVDMAESIEVPPIPRLFADDATPQAVASLLAEQGGRLAIISSEGGILEIIGGRYSGKPDMDTFLKGHSGGTIRVDRMGRPTEYVRRPALTLGLMIQPSVLTAIGASDAFRGRGLLARFLYAAPPSKWGFRTIGADPVPVVVRERYDALVGGLVYGFAPWTDPAILRLSPEAGARELAFEADIEREFRASGLLEGIEEWGAKHVGTVCRIAGLLHLAEYGEPGHRKEIGIATMANAIDLGGYYLHHAVHAFAAMQTDKPSSDARYLLSSIRRLAPEFSTRDLFNVVTRGRFPKVSDLDPAICVLVENQWLVPVAVTERAGQPGRPPSPRWIVNPLAFASEQ